MKFVSHRLSKVLGRFQSRLFQGAVILRYHRVADPPLDPYGLCVSPERFSEHLALIKRHAVPMQLQQLVRCILKGTLPRRAAVVTFDDGYADNLYHAKPLLERHEVPATVFVTTAYTESQREFWSDELEQVLLSAGPLPQAFNLDRGGINLRWELGEAANYSQKEYQRDRTWNVKGNNDPTSRHRLFRRLHDLLKPLSHDQRHDLLDALHAWSGLQTVVRSSHKPLSPDELIRLADGNLIEVGAHSVTHPVLSRLSAASQRKEIMQCKSYLEQVLGGRVASFAYPYGHPHDYTMETIDILREAGFECACSTIPARVGRRADPFQLPRLYVGNWDAQTFRRQCLDGPD